MAVNYANENLFYQDSVEKQMVMTYTGGSITNENLNEDDFELEEVLNSGKDLNFGECNSAKIAFSVSYYDKSIAGKRLSVKTTPYGGADFPIGQYNVISDNPDDNRKKRKVIAYDDLYKVLKTDYTAWYNTLFPDTNTTKTGKQIRDSFFTYVGITQKTQTLPLDNISFFKRTIDPTTLSGKDILTKFCQINGCFGKICRDGEFKYVFLEEPAEGLFPSNTLYPANDLYPERYGMAKEYTHTYLEDGLKYEDYLVTDINKLIILDSKGELSVSVGSGNNAFIVSDNFWLFGMTAEQLTTIANAMFTKISGRWYRPAKINSIGNPCIETGDGLRLVTPEGKQIDTYVLKRTLVGIQTLFDTYEADGFQNRANNNNSLNSKFNQINQDIKRIEADYVKTTYLEANYATIENLNAVSLRVGSIEADYVTANQLSAVDAKFENLNASKITSGSMNGSYISAGTISADRLNVNSFRSSQLDCAHLNSINSYIYFGGYQFTIAYAGNGHWDFTSDRPPT